MNKSTERVKEFQKRLKEKGLKELRGAYAKPENHKKYKDMIKKNEED